MKTLASLSLVFLVLILPELVVFYLWQSESEIIWNFLIKLGGFLIVVAGVFGIIFGIIRTKNYAEQEKVINTRGVRINDLEAELVRKNKRIEELEYLETLIELRKQGDDDRARRLKAK